MFQYDLCFNLEEYTFKCLEERNHAILICLRDLHLDPISISPEVDGNTVIKLLNIADEVYFNYLDGLPINSIVVTLNNMTFSETDLSSIDDSEMLKDILYCSDEIWFNTPNRFPKELEPDKLGVYVVNPELEIKTKEVSP